MKKAILVFILIMGAGVTSACNSAPTLGQGGAELPTPTPLPTPVIPEKPTYIVQRGEVINALTFTGRVSPVIEEELAFGRQGTVKTVFVAQGEDVKAGDVIAELDISELEKAVSEATVALQSAEFELEKAKLEHTEKLIQAEINLQKEELNQQKAALEKGSSPLTSKQFELQTAQESVGASAQAYQEALSNPNVDQNTIDSLARGLEQAEQQLLIAEAAYNDQVRAQGAAGIDAQLKALDAEIARIEYEKLLQGISPSFANDIIKAQANLEEAQGKLTDAKLIAPFDGRILSINIKRGSDATAFKAVAVIAQLDQLELTANLGSSDLEKLSIDQPILVTIRNRPSEELSGLVRTLPYPYGGGSGGDGEGGNNNEKVVRFTIDPEKHPDVELKLGELADIEVRLEAKQDVLWLSPNAIRRFQGRRFVVIQEGDGQRRVDVRIGIESEERIEILEGVEAGETVIGE